MAYPQSIDLHPQFSLLNASFSILLPQISLIKPQFSILSQKNGIFHSNPSQISLISNKMSASAACTTCSFFQVWLALKNNYRRGGADLKKGALHFKNTRTKDLKVLIVIFFLNSGSKQHVWSNVIWNDIGKK